MHMTKKNKIISGAVLGTIFILFLLIIRPWDRLSPPEPEILPVAPPPAELATTPEPAPAPEKIPEPAPQPPQITQAPHEPAPIPAPVPVKPPLPPEEELKEAQQNELYETLVQGSFPVHTIETYNPEDPDNRRNPPPGEIWVRIKPENAGEMHEIMAELADLYKDIATEYQDKEVTVMQWVGAQPYARHVYSPDGSIVRR